MSKILSIIIPTYNRAYFLDQNLKKIGYLKRKFDFDLIVCNNSSSDSTERIINKWQTKYDFKLVSQVENVGYDRNVASGYSVVETDYCMLLGDSSTISEKNLSKIIEYLELNKPTAIIHNGFGRLNMKDRIYTNVEEIVRDIGWYLTLLSSCVISRDFLSNERICRYFDTGFVHLGVFLDYLSTQDVFEVHYISSVQLEKLSGDKRSTDWSKTPFLVFGKRWFMFIFMLPLKISLESKLKCLKDHDAYTNIFSPVRLLARKMEGYVSFEDYKESRPFMPFVTRYPIIIFDFICYCVTKWYWCVKIMKRICKTIKRNKC